MSKITVTTIAGATSGADANKVKIESGDTLEIVNGSQTINRTGNGVAQTIQNSGTTVGEIGVNSTDNMYFVSTNTGFKLGKDESAVIPAQSGGSNNDNALDLGFSTVRWKDLYLSGGLKIGGTGSANTLDDYEEGSWTPVWANGSGQTYNLRVGRYTKIGNSVTVWCNIITSSMNSQTGDAHVGGLPFPVVNITNFYATGAVNGDNNWDTNLSTQNLVTLATGGQTVLRPRYNSGLNTSDVRLEHIGGGNSYFSTSVTYMTD